MTNREGDDEGGAGAGFAGGGDDAAVAVGDAPADGEADAGAFILVAGMQALEDGEDFIEVLFVEADAVVLNGQLTLFGIGILIGRAGKETLEDPGVDFDQRLSVWRLELEGVDDQV